MKTIHEQEYKIYTDGACSGNPGRGAWAAIIKNNDGTHTEMSQAYSHTTNNRMELRAVIESLKEVSEGSRATVVTDSQYVANAVNKKWLMSWAQRNWRTSQKKPVANKDLWESFLMVMKNREVVFEWVKGHEGHVENERCDELAVNAYTKGPWIADEGYDSATSTTSGQTSFL
ncbi:ribonuclease HI [Candidatus Woesebacteria bacterium]|nr:ribonuclease HI [Candidatus Woesebacteria bacterium]